MHNTIHLFGSIAKVEDQADGTIKVYGVASSGGRDTAGEIVLPDAMKGALPDYSRFPALREMHQPLAAGKVLEADVDGGGVTNIVAHVVDPVAIKKVKTGVYKGFSIGGKVTERDPGDRSIITGLRLIEISLVDSPCNPDAILSMWKADMSIFTPPSEAVVARAKLLAAKAGDGIRKAKFSEFLFEAREELISEYLLEKGSLDTEPEAEVVEEPVAAEPKEAAAAAEPVAEAPAIAEPVAEAEVAADVPEADAAAAAAADPNEGEHGGEGAVENDEPQAKEAADPAAAITAAVEKGNAAIADAAPAPAAEPVDLFADLGKAADALRCISSESPLAQKSLWHVSRLADLISGFASLQQCVKSEADCEGDSSAVAQEMADHVKAMGAMLVTMAQEEVAELLSDPSCETPCAYIGDYCEYAAEIVDLVKGNADLMAEASVRNPKLDDDAAKAADAEEIEKADEIAAKDAEIAALEKKLADAAPAVEATVDGLTGTIDTLKSEIAELRKRFNDEPLPPKTAGPATAVTKGADSAGNDAAAAAPALTPEDFQKALAELPEKQRGEVLLRIALAQPKLVIPAR